eukprot:TRINITY_DN11297_c0_g1_i1.p1 TRINITY_DN11297_c0_g1~~TRINITY_DN11297_c0_g1_i1.p1  ORF type:complete len:671 (+),score=133.48 TRINITY_DN11297_c0_g1_i1:118-2130(+)
MARLRWEMKDNGPLHILNPFSCFSPVINSDGKLQIPIRALITRFVIWLLITALLAIVAVIVNIAVRRASVLSGLAIVALVVVAALPIALPVGWYATLRFGARSMAQNGVIITNFDAMLNLARVDVLLADMHGTLTTNRLSVEIPVPFRGFESQDVIRYGALASSSTQGDAYDTALCAAASAQPQQLQTSTYQLRNFTTGVGWSEAEVTDPEGHIVKIAKGAPRVMLQRCQLNMPSAKYQSLLAKADRIVSEMGSLAFHCVAVVRTREDDLTSWRAVGIVPFSDPPRDDAPNELQALSRLGINVKLITHSSITTAQETASRLGLPRGNIVDSSVVQPYTSSGDHGAIMAEASAAAAGSADDVDAATALMSASGISLSNPLHREEIVRVVQAQGHTVAITGDGLQHVRAAQQADVAVAVHGATLHLQSVAGALLLDPGLRGVIHAVMQSREVFSRLNRVVRYHIFSKTQLLLVFVLALCIWDLHVNYLQMALLVVITDGVALSLTADGAAQHQHRRPLQWNIRSLFASSLSMALVSVAGSLAIVALCGHVWMLDTTTLATVLYLQQSTCAQWAILQLRAKRRFFLLRFRPNWLLLASLLVAQMMTVLFSAYGVGMAAVGWRLVGIVWGMALLVCVVEEAVKVLVSCLVQRRTTLRTRHAHAGGDLTLPLLHE